MYPATSTESERMFRKAEFLINERRSSLKAKNILVDMIYYDIFKINININLIFTMCILCRKLLTFKNKHTVK